MAINQYRDTQKDLLKQGLNKVGTPGLSQRQKSQQIMPKAQQLAGQNIQVQQALINQQAMAGGMPQGDAFKQSQQLASETSAAAAAIAPEVEGLSAEIQAAERARTDAALAYQSDKTSQNWQTAANMLGGATQGVGAAAVTGHYSKKS